MTETVTSWKNLSDWVQRDVMSTSGDVHNLFNLGTMISMGHPRTNGGYRSGGPWSLDKQEHYFTLKPKIHKLTGAGSLPWHGSVAPVHIGTIPPLPNLANASTMDARGASAMSKVLPTAPSVGMLTSLAELYREGLPKILGMSAWESRAQIARAAGSEYLNSVFGWLPLVSDVQGAISTFKDMDDILKQYIQDSERKIFRRYDYPKTETTSIVIGGATGRPTSANQFWSGSTTNTTSVEEWFEGCFMYHLPKGDDFMGKLAQFEAKASKLYGLRVTPEVLWNLTPWSWATDWFANIGDVMKNTSALGKDGLALLYGYHMKSTVVRRYTHATTVVDGRTVEGEMLSIYTCKQRRPANPYGFGTSGFALSSRQKAVVAAIIASAGKGRSN